MVGCKTAIATKIMVVMVMVMMSEGTGHIEHHERRSAYECAWTTLHTLQYSTRVNL